jgi:hypothetical protein
LEDVDASLIILIVIGVIVCTPAMRASGPDGGGDG